MRLPGKEQHLTQSLSVKVAADPTMEPKSADSLSIQIGTSLNPSGMRVNQARLGSQRIGRYYLQDKR